MKKHILYVIYSKRSTPDTVFPWPGLFSWTFEKGLELSVDLHSLKPDSSLSLNTRPILPLQPKQPSALGLQGYLCFLEWYHIRRILLTYHKLSTFSHIQYSKVTWHLELIWLAQKTFTITGCCNHEIIHNGNICHNVTIMTKSLSIFGKFSLFFHILRSWLLHMVSYSLTF